jgi:type IV pilus assembly protein PilA
VEFKIPPHPTSQEPRPMLTPRNARNDDAGFTLIELAVVILIIGLLLLLAIPSFLGVRRRATEKSAQMSLRVALTDAKALQGDTDDYSAATAASVIENEPGYTHTTNDTTSSLGVKNLSIGNSTTDWGAAAWSPTGVCFLIHDSAADGTFFAKTRVATDCTGQNALVATGNGWN